MSVNPRRHGGGVHFDPPPSSFLALDFCSLTDYQKLWHNCSLIVKTSFDSTCVLTTKMQFFAKKRLFSPKY